MFNFQNIRVGADPEIFFMTKAGIPQSAEGLLGGTKREPKPMFDQPLGYFVQEDNVAGEFNIPPASNARDFSNSLNKGIKYLEKVAKSKDLQVKFFSALHFPKEQLDTLHAKMLGCEPDMNAWSGEENPRPTPPETLRTAAGHVHVGWDNPVNDERRLLLQTMDLLLGVPSILVTLKNERRELYGKAGACRIKPYGVEYRTLDNFWIASHENRKHVFDMCVKACTALSKNFDQTRDIILDFEDMIVKCINEHDMDLAATIVQKFSIPQFPKSAL